MKPAFLTLSFLLLIVCTTLAQTSTIDAGAFAKKIKSTPNAVVVDVRTPQEYAQGHIKNAVNINWNGANFEKEAGKLNKSKPVFVYCQAGGRSAAAVAKMQKMGFKTIIELKGGLGSWENAKLPVVK